MSLNKRTSHWASSNFIYKTPQSGWGTKKKAYYGADTQDYEIDSDEERAEMEEVESRRLQKENFALHDEEVVSQTPCLSVRYNC